MYFRHLYTNAFQHIKNKGNLFFEVKVIGPLLAGLPLKGKQYTAIVVPKGLETEIL